MSNASDFVINNGVLEKYVGPGGNVVIPDSVMSIDEEAFMWCSSLTSVTIPDSVTSIGSSAFSGCSDLTSVTIPNSVTSIGDEAFSGCRSLTSVTILGGNVTIGKEMIKDCPALERLTLHHWNPNLKDFPRDDKHILICAEDKIADLPANRRLQAAAGFALLPNKDMTTDWAKSYLDYIKKNAIKLINVAFKETALMQLMCEYSLIPAKDYDAYLAEAEKSENAEIKAMVLAYMKKLGIASLSIAREKNEKKVDAFEEAWINRMAKRDPSQGLEGVTFVIAGKLNLWKTRDEVKEFLELWGAHLGTKITKKTDYLVINDRRSNPAIVIEAEGYGIPVKTENEFNEMIGAKYQDAKNITIPSGLKVIRKEAFSGCRSLTSVTIPDSVTSIGDSAFSGCSSLTSVTIPDSVTSIGNGAFSHCSSLKNVVIPDGVTEIGNWAFSACSSLTSVTIPNSVTSIGTGAFSGCSSLTSVTIPNSVTSIENSTFSGCSSLTSVIIPNSVTSIGACAFSGCSSLKNVVIPDGVTEIGYYAFSDCSSLTSVTIPDSVTSFGDWAFAINGGFKGVIHAPKGSHAIKYAKRKNYKYVEE